MSLLWHLHQQNFITGYLNVLNGKPTLAQEVTFENHFLAAGCWSLHPLHSSVTPTIKRYCKMYSQLNKLSHALNMTLIEIDRRNTQLHHHFYNSFEEELKDLTQQYAAFEHSTNLLPSPNMGVEGAWAVGLLGTFLCLCGLWASTTTKAGGGLWWLVAGFAPLLYFHLAGSRGSTKGARAVTDNPQAST